MRAFSISIIRQALLAALLACGLAIIPRFEARAQTDPLPSWNDGAVKKSITDFVARATTQGGADFVPVEQRIATFDNDGTLWCEQPFYFQMAFAFDRVKAMAPQHPEWKTQQPFKGVLERDRNALAAAGEHQFAYLLDRREAEDFVRRGYRIVLSEDVRRANILFRDVDLAEFDAVVYDAKP